MRGMRAFVVVAAAADAAALGVVVVVRRRGAWRRVDGSVGVGVATVAAAAAARAVTEQRRRRAGSDGGGAWARDAAAAAAARWAGRVCCPRSMRERASRLTKGRDEDATGLCSNWGRGVGRWAQISMFQGVRRRCRSLLCEGERAARREERVHPLARRVSSPLLSSPFSRRPCGASRHISQPFSPNPISTCTPPP